ncbi:ParA family protein [Conexibacter sp. DBS9H8]|uniref:ParA family protein n=1 Tax=Conexibacter sp. DBS9H8 TaxID=2937801 RepID=UPI00200D2E63|nr:ParA family protein [Conexibacter sp. DBS9H8]
MATVIATYNIKGGVGKTSAAVNLAYLAARDGGRTLLWDLDPQAASTYLFRIRPRVRGGSDALIRRRTPVLAQIKATDHDRLDLLPADFSYRHMDLALDSFKHPTRRLAKVLEPLAEDYDTIFLDCPPSISLVSESVFDAADVLLVPIIPATLSSRTFDQLAELAGAAGGPRVFAFFSMVETHKALHRRVMARLRGVHQLTMLGAAIPASEDVEAMGEERDPVGAFAPASSAAMAYEALWWDLRRRLAVPA